MLISSSGSSLARHLARCSCAPLGCRPVRPQFRSSHGAIVTRRLAVTARQPRLLLMRSSSISNKELLTGDALVLTCFSLYKQISSVVMSASFPGWLAPLGFNPIRFVEFVGFGCMLVASWVAASILVGGYRSAENADLPSTLRKTSLTWLVSMPVVAAQLVISTAAESQALVGDDGWFYKMPLAASGVGEPFATAAGVLGVMTIWRAFYCTHLGEWGGWSTNGPGADRFREAVLIVCIMAATGLVVLATLQLLLPPDNIERLDGFLHLTLSLP